MIAIIDYNAGNSTSVKYAIERLGYECIITDKHQRIHRADKVVLPGVGEAHTAMQYLKAMHLDQVIISLQQPVLGICLGQQLLCSFSEESNTPCLGVFNAQVKRFPATGIVPHMGWNTFNIIRQNPLLDNISNIDDVYFVHSYYCEINADTIASCDYLLPFSAAMNKANFYATQFHPEKSASIGNTILANFLKL